MSSLVRAMGLPSIPLESIRREISPIGYRLGGYRVVR